MSVRDPETIEEELALFAEAIEAGIAPFPPKKETKPIARYALAWFMVIIMITWVSKILMRVL